MQGALGFSAIECGLAFLPMASALMLTSMGIASRLLPRLGPRVLVPGGLALAAAGLTYLTGIDVSPGYAVSALPGMVVIAAGFGLAVPSAMATATRGVAPAQAGVASAMVNACQQVGGLARRLAALHDLRDGGERLRSRAGHPGPAGRDRRGAARLCHGLPLVGRDRRGGRPRGRAAARGQAKARSRAG